MNAHDRYALIDDLDWRLDHEIAPALARALNAEAHGWDPATRWRDLATELLRCADMANSLAGAQETEA